MDFASMKRWDLQALCKRHGLAGGGTNADLVARLAAAIPGCGGTKEQALGVVAGKGCLKRTAASGSSGGGSDAAKKVSFVLEEEAETDVELEARVKGRRGRPRVMWSPVVAKTRGRRKAGETLPGAGVGRVERRMRAASGDSTDESDVGEAGADAPVRRSRRNAVHSDAGDGVEMVAGAASRNNSAKAVEEEEDVGEAVDRKRKRKTRENDEVADASGQVGVSRRSMRSSGLLSEPASVSSPVVEKKRGRRKAGAVTEQTCVEEQPCEAQHFGKTLRSELAVVGPVLPTVAESKRSRRKVQEGEHAVEKVAKVEISGRTTRSSSVADAAASPFVAEKKRRRKTEDVHSDGEPPTVQEVPINAAPVTRVLRNRAVQVNGSVVEETNFDKKLENKKQPSRPSTRSRGHQHLASSAEEGSQEQVAPPCMGSPPRRSRRNHSEADELLNNNTASESNNWSRAPTKGNDLKMARLSTLSAAKDGVEDGVAKADGHLELKNRNPRNGRAKVARNGGEVPCSDSSGKASAMEMEVVVAEPVRRSRRASGSPTLLEQGAKGMRGSIRGQELQNTKDEDVEKQPTVEEPVRRFTRKSLVPAMLEKERKDLTTEVVPEAHVRRLTRKSVAPAMLEKERKGIPAKMNPDAHVIVGRSMQKSIIPGMLDNEDNDHSEMQSAKAGKVEKQLGVEEPVRRLTRNSIVPAVFEKDNKGLHKDIKPEAFVRRSVRNSVAPNAVDKMNNGRREVVRTGESGGRTRSSKTRLQFAVQNAKGLQRTTRKSSKLVISQLQSIPRVSKGRPAKRIKTTVLHMPVEEPNADDIVMREATQDAGKVTHSYEYSEVSSSCIQEIRQVNATVKEFPSASLLEDTHIVQSVNEGIHESESGLTKSSHEEQVASGQLVFLEAANCMEKTKSEAVVCKDDENKKPVNYINSSCEETDANAPAEHAYCISGTLLSSSLVAPANDNAELHHSSALSRLESTDFLDEPIGCSSTEVPQQGLKEQCEALHMPIEEPNADDIVIREATQDGDECKVLHMPVEEPNADDTVIREATEDGHEVTHEYSEVSSSCNQEIRQIKATGEEIPSAPLLGTLLEDIHRLQSMNEIHGSESGFTKSSHEEHDASGQFIFLEATNCMERTKSEGVACKDEENKKPVNYTSSSCEQTDANGSADHAYCISDTLLSSSLIAPVNDNDELHHSLDLSRSESTDFLDEPMGCSNNEVPQQGLKERKVHNEEKVAYGVHSDLIEVAAVKDLDSGVLPFTGEEKSNLRDAQPNSKLEGTEVVESGPRFDKDISNILESGSSVNCVVEKTPSDLSLPEGSSMDHYQRHELFNGLSVEESHQESAMHLGNSDLGGGTTEKPLFHLAIPNYNEGALSEETVHSVKIDAERCPLESQTLAYCATISAKKSFMPEPIEGPESGKALLPAVETSALADEQPNLKREGDEFKEHSLRYLEDCAGILAAGSVKNNITHLAKECLMDSCQEKDKLPNDLSAPKSLEESAICQDESVIRSGICQSIGQRCTDEINTKDHKEEHNGHNEDQVTTCILASGMSEPASFECSESGIILLPTAETSALPDEKLNAMVNVNDEHSLICDKDNSNIFYTESVGNNKLFTLNDDPCPDMPASKSPEESATCPDDSFSASVGICQTSGQRCLDEINTKPLSYNISSTVKGSYIALDTPSGAKQGDNPSQSAVAFLGNSVNSPAAKTDPPKLSTDNSVAEDSSTQMLHGFSGRLNDVELAADNPHSKLAMLQVQQDDVHVQEGILEKTLSDPVTSECKHERGLPEDTVLHSTGNDRCSSSVEQSQFGLQSLFLQENMEQPKEYGASDVGLAAENPGNKLAMELVQQDDVQVQGTLEKTAPGSATSDCEHECRLPEEVEMHLPKNERCSSIIEQSAFGLQSLFSQESIEEPTEYDALALARVQAGNGVGADEYRIERTLLLEPVSDHESQVDLSVVAKNGDCVYTSQQDNEKKGLPKPSHEHEHGASGQLDSLDAANSMKKDTNSEEISATRDALLNSSLIDPTIGNDEILSSVSISMYQSESTDFMDEPIGCSNTEVLQQGSTEKSDEHKEDQVAYEPCTRDMIEDLDSGIPSLPAEGRSNLRDERLNCKLEDAEAVESDVYCDKDIGNISELGSAVNTVGKRTPSDSSLSNDSSMYHYQQKVLLNEFSKEKSPEESAVPAAMEKLTFDLAIPDSTHKGALCEEAVCSTENDVEMSSPNLTQLPIELQFSQETMEGSNMPGALVLPSTENVDDSNTCPAELQPEENVFSDPDSRQDSHEDLSRVQEKGGCMFSFHLDGEQEDICQTIGPRHTIEFGTKFHQGRKEEYNEQLNFELEGDEYEEHEHTCDNDTSYDLGAGSLKSNISIQDYEMEWNEHIEVHYNPAILARGMSGPALIERSESETTLLPAPENSPPLPDVQLNRMLERNKEHSLSCDKGTSNISETGLVENNNLSGLPENSYMDPCHEQDLPFDNSAPKSPQESAICPHDSVLGSVGTCQTSGRRRIDDEISTKLLSFKISSAVRGSYIAMDAPSSKQGDNLSESAIALLRNIENAPAAKTDHPPKPSTDRSAAKKLSRRALQPISGRPKEHD